MLYVPGNRSEAQCERDCCAAAPDRADSVVELLLGADDSATEADLDSLLLGDDEDEEPDDELCGGGGVEAENDRLSTRGAR